MKNNKLRDFLIVIAMMGLVIAGQFFESKTDPLSIYQQEIKSSMSTLDEQNLDMQPNRFKLDILPAKTSKSGSEISLMMQNWDTKSHPVIYWLDWHSENLTYTMSASGLDNRQHLVNTYLEGYAPFEVDNVMTPLYILAKRKSYQFDAKNYHGREDVWQSSKQAYFYSRGDCEDHSIILADWLISMGEDARVVVGNWKNTGHAWVVLYRDGTAYLLEATQKSGIKRNKAYPFASLYPDYEPEYMFNRDNFWVTTAKQIQVKSIVKARGNIYADKYWEKRSQYHKLE